MKAPTESEERFRALVQYASDIITILGVDGTVLYESPALERLLGYRPEELIGTNAFNYIHPDDVEQVLSVFAQTLKTGGVGPLVEFRFRHADGSWRHLEAVGNSLVEDPNVRGVVVNSRDITERKQAEEGLRFQRALLEAQTEASMNGIFFAPPEGKIFLLNHLFL